MTRDLQNLMSLQNLMKQYHRDSVRSRRLLWVSMGIGVMAALGWVETWLALAIAVCLIAVFLVLDYRQQPTNILLWLKLRGGWHYGLDLVKSGIAGRGSVYIHLTRLEEQGLIERRDELEPDPRLSEPRSQFRAIEGVVT